LRSLSQGRASFNQRFADYTPVPYEVQQNIAKQRQEVEAVS
jgi:elongation factor G